MFRNAASSNPTPGRTCANRTGEAARGRRSRYCSCESRRYAALRRLLTIRSNRTRKPDGGILGCPSEITVEVHTGASTASAKQWHGRVECLGRSLPLILRGAGPKTGARKRGQAPHGIVFHAGFAPHGSEPVPVFGKPAAYFFAVFLATFGNGLKSGSSFHLMFFFPSWVP